MIKTKLTNGVAIFEIDVQDRPMNVIHSGFLEALESEVKKATQDSGVKGLVITSQRKEFLAGADLDMVRSLRSEKESLAMTGRLHRVFRHLETWGKPVVAAINGTALGGGFELCLACHYRICLSDSHLQIGLPEVKLGLLPGGGGTQRLPRLIGIQPALPLLLEGRALDPKKAKEQGLVHELAETKEQLLQKAFAWIQANPGPKQPWDDPKFKIPGGEVGSPKGYQVLPATAAMVTEKTHGNYPAPKYILSCLYEGLQLPFERALQVEQAYFAKLTQTKEAKLMIRTLFYSVNECNKGVMRPKNIPEQSLKKVGILGAGMMGSGIAYVSAMAGVPVVLKDASKEKAEFGKGYAKKLLDQAVEKGRMTAADREQKLALIETSADPGAMAGADLVVEAVIEDRKLKAQVTHESEAVIGAQATFASNTSTLPITGLAKESKRPENFIGLHFFSPVEKMPLVEIILGEKSGPEALARCLDYVKKLKKTPIVVNDGRGFYTSRVFTTYVSEGMACLNEGIAPALIENAGRKAGMAVGPLTVADEVSLELMLHVFKQTIADLGESAIDQSIYRTADQFVSKWGRLGRKVGKGFFDYPADGKKQLWSELGQHFPLAKTQPSLEEVSRRLLTIQVVETCRVFEEKVLMHPRDADVGSIMGWGFPAYTGGALSYIEWRGLDRFLSDCAAFGRLGPRFQPTSTLLKMKEKNIASFYELV